MGGEIVHHDDVTAAQAGDEDLLNVGLEHFTIHGAVEQHWRGHAVQPQRAGEGRGFPMPVGHGGDTTLATFGPSTQACHLRGGTGLVDKHQVFSSKVRLRQAPRRTLGRDVWPLLFGGVRRFF